MSRNQPKKIKERFIRPASLSTSTSLAGLAVLCLISWIAVFKDKAVLVIVSQRDETILYERKRKSPRTSLVRTDLFTSAKNLICQSKFYASIVELTFFGVIGSNRLCVAISLRDQLCRTHSLRNQIISHGICSLLR